MKKMFLTLVAMLSMTTVFAENESAANINTIESYNRAVNMKRLGQVLELSKDQAEAVEEIHKTFCAEMMLAAQYGKDEREKMVDKAVRKDLTYMGYILNKSQYRKYLTLLNLTLTNRGLK